jgi:hypothetical protein
MTGDDLDDETQLHLFIKNRKSDTSDSGDPGSLAQHIQNYADGESNWFDKTSYLGVHFSQMWEAVLPMAIRGG